MTTTGPRAPAGAGFYIPSLDGLRAVAVLTVFFSHVGFPQLVLGGFGVTIFFFLSGFLITTLLRLEAERTGSVSLKDFYLRRALRIFPPMYLALGVAMATSAVLGEHLALGTIGLQAIHFTNYHLALGGLDHPAGSEVMWSLAVEEHFYLVFPLAYGLLRRWQPQPERQAAVLLGVCGLVLLWRCVLIVGDHATPLYVMYATDTRVDSILFGCVLALWRNPALAPAAGEVDRRFGARPMMLAVVAALGVLAATKFLQRVELRETVRYSIQGLALMPIFIAAIQWHQRLPWRLLALAPVRWLGLISYSLYLLHVPVIELLRRYAPGSEGKLAVLALAGAVGASTLVYFAIEQPCARLRKRLSHVVGVGPVRRAPAP